MNESGHAKNIATFANSISIVKTFGTAFNPPVPQIEVPALETRLTEFEAVKSAVTPKESAETLALNDRQAEFDTLSPLITRITAAAAVSNSDPLFISNLRTITRKLQGRRATAKVKDNPLTLDVDESKQSISASQMSFDNRIAYFEELINLLGTSGSYVTNESDLTIRALSSKLADMKTKNTAAVNAVNEARAARIARDNTLYNDTDGIIALANLVKNYVKSVFGTQSLQYKQLTALQFRRPGK